ncbi:MAG: hypothetical protein HYY24_09630 [Verrucomicrobia bacterium]|nr:hypothetical protein [Verrucomicrobiota bacterium]
MRRLDETSEGTQRRIIFAGLAAGALGLIVVLFVLPRLDDRRSNFSGEWRGTSAWPGLVFEITFTITDHNDGIVALRAVVRCVQQAAETKAAREEPAGLLIQPSEDTIRIVNGHFNTQGSGLLTAVGAKASYTVDKLVSQVITGRFLSSDQAEGTFDLGIKLECVKERFDVSGKWTAGKQR